MRKISSYLLIITVFLGLSGVSLAEEVKTTQSKIITIDSAEKYIGVKLDGKRIKMYTDEDTKVTKGGKNIRFSDLDVRDKVEITYAKEEDFLGLDEDFLAKKIKVEKVKTEGIG